MNHKRKITIVLIVFIVVGILGITIAEINLVKENPIFKKIVHGAATSCSLNRLTYQDGHCISYSGQQYAYCKDGIWFSDNRTKYCHSKSSCIADSFLIESNNSCCGSPNQTSGKCLNVQPTASQSTCQSSVIVQKLSNTGNPQKSIYFTTNVHLLPDTIPETGYTLEKKYIVPKEIILHWDGNLSTNTNYWKASTTYSSLSTPKTNPETGEQFLVNVHFAVGVDGVLQMFEMREGDVRLTNGAYGYFDVINIEMAGAYFNVTNGVPNVPEAEIEAALDLVIKLMTQYNISQESIVGHYERDTRDKYGNETGINRGKPDPGVNFLSYFKNRIAERLNCGNR